MQIQDEFDVSPGDFPDVRHMKDKLAGADWSQFRTFDRQQILKLDKLLSEDMTKLMQVVPGPNTPWRSPVETQFNGPIEAAINAETPFRREGKKKREFSFIIEPVLSNLSLYEDSYEADYEWDQKHTEGWVVANDPSYPVWVASFSALNPKDGKISGSVAKREMVKSKLPNPTLSK